MDLTALRPLVEAIEASWARETSADPANWSPANPAFGQCAVTALVVQDALGGYLLRTMVGNVSHYYNGFELAAPLDLTWRQFPADSVPSAAPEQRTREYVLSYAPTVQRYAILRDRVSQKLAQTARRAG